MWRKRLTDLASVKAGIQQAREYQKGIGKPLSIESLSFALEIDRHTVSEYADGKHIPELREDGSNAEEVAEQREIAAALSRAKAECLRDLVNFSTDKGNMMGPVFQLKNNYGYVDKVEQSLTVEVPRFTGEGELE